MFVQDVIVCMISSTFISQCFSTIRPIFKYPYFPRFSLFSQTLDDFLKYPISFKTPGDFPFYLSTGSRISSLIPILPANFWNFKFCSYFSKKLLFPVYLPNFIQNFCHVLPRLSNPIICFSLKIVAFKILFSIMLNIPCGSAEGIGIVVWSWRDQRPRYFSTLVTDSEWEMDSIKSVKEGAQTIKEEIDPAIYRLFKRMMIEILSEQAEANFGKVPVKEEASITIPMSIIGDHNRATSAKPSNNKNRGNQSSKLEESKDLKGKYSRIQNRPFQSSPQQKEKNQGKPKRGNWSGDRDFTPIDKPLDEVLEYMLIKGLVKLPKATSPPTIMGRFKNQFCKFHRAVGHDTDRCFVFKNIVQDYIDKNLFVESREEERPVALTKQVQSNSKKEVKEVSIQQKSNNPKKIKRDGWSYDREFTPLGESIEEILGYLLAKDMIKLPRIVDPPVTMGKWKDCFCDFHRAVGHDTERCFVLKNIVQDYIDKELLVPEEREGQVAVLTKPLPDHSEAWQCQCLLILLGRYSPSGFPFSSHHPFLGINKIINFPHLIMTFFLWLFCFVTLGHLFENLFSSILYADRINKFLISCTCAFICINSYSFAFNWINHNPVGIGISTNSPIIIPNDPKIIANTEPKPSTQTGIISKSSIQAGTFSTFWKTEFRLVFLFKSFSFVDPGSDSWSLYFIRASTRTLHFPLLIRVPTRDLSTLFEPRLELFIFLCWSGFRLVISLLYSSIDSNSSFSFVDPGSDSWSLCFIRASTRTLHFPLLIRVPTRDLSTLFEPRLELFIFLCWSGFRLVISLLYSSLDSNSSFSFVDPGSDSWSLYFIRASTRTLYFPLLIRVPTRDLSALFEPRLELFIFLCWSGFRLVISLLYSSLDSNSSFSFVDPGSDSWSLYFIRASTRTLHFPLLIRVPTRDLSALFEPRLELFIFICWSGFRLVISLLYSSLDSNSSFSFVDPGSDSWSLYLIRALTRTLHFPLLIRVPTRDLSNLFEPWLELFIFICWSGFRLEISLFIRAQMRALHFLYWSGFRLKISLFIWALIRALHFLCWSGFRLVISLSYSSLDSSSSFSLLIRVPTRDLFIFIRAHIRALHFSLLIRVPTRDLIILFVLWFEPSIFFCWSGFRLVTSIFYSSSDSNSSFSFIDPSHFDHQGLSIAQIWYFALQILNSNLLDQSIPNFDPRVTQFSISNRAPILNSNYQILNFDSRSCNFDLRVTQFSKFWPSGHSISNFDLRVIQFSKFWPSGHSISNFDLRVIQFSNFDLRVIQSPISTFGSLNFQFLTFGSINFQFFDLRVNQFSISTFGSHNLDLRSTNSQFRPFWSNQFSISTVRSSNFDLRVIQFSTTNFPISNFDLRVNQSQYPISIIFSCERPFLGRVRGSSFFSHAIQFVHLAPFLGRVWRDSRLCEPFAKQFPISHKEPF